MERGRGAPNARVRRSNPGVGHESEDEGFLVVFVFFEGPLQFFEAVFGLRVKVFRRDEK